MDEYVFDRWVLLGEETNSGALNDSMSSVLELQFVVAYRLTKTHCLQLPAY